jgi:hypothetical protein
MKKLLSLLSGMAIVLTFGMALAEDNAGQTKDPGNVTVRDDDLPRINLDQDRATLNQTPAETGADGSAPGGVSGESDLIKDIKIPADVDKLPAEEGARGETGKVPEKSPEKYGY